MIPHTLPRIHPPFEDVIRHFSAVKTDMFSHHVTLTIKGLSVHRKSSTRCQLSPVSVDMASFTVECEGIVRVFIVTTRIDRDAYP